MTLPQADYEEVCRIADAEKVSASWVVRYAIDRLLASEMPLLRRQSLDTKFD